MRRKSLGQIFKELAEAKGYRVYCPQDAVQGIGSGENGRRKAPARAGSSKAPAPKPRRSATSASRRRPK